MSRELLTSWTDYQSAIDRLLALAAKRIWIYDEDLGMLHLETAERIAMFKRPLVSTRQDCLRIALRNTAPLRRYFSWRELYGGSAGELGPLFSWSTLRT